MKLTKRVGAVVISSALLLSALAGCAPKEVSVPVLTAAEIDLTTVKDPIMLTTGMSGDTIVATVGDQEINVAEVLYYTAYSADMMLQYYTMFGMTELPWDEKGENGLTSEENMLEDALNVAALYALLPVKAEEEGIIISDEDMATMEAVLAESIEELGSEQASTYVFWQEPMTEALYREQFIAGTFYQEFRDKYFSEGTDGYPTDEEVVAYAGDELGMYMAKHILIKTIDDAGAPLPEAEVASQLALAEDLLKQLQESSDPITLFDELMHEHSEDGRTPDGALGAPDGYLATPGQMVPEFEEAALSLKVGEISGLVPTQFGYHIVQRMDVTASEEHRNSMIGTAMMEMQNQWMEETPVVKTEAFENIAVREFYANLSVLRQVIGIELTEMMEQPDSSTPAE